jgi:Flp pilus assembly protein TadG
MRVWAHRRLVFRGQAMVEFALVFGLFMLVVGGIIQFGIILWTQNTVNDIARDTARWAVTYTPPVQCESTDFRMNIAQRADTMARQRLLVGYPPGTWSAAPAQPLAAAGDEGVFVNWFPDSGFDVDCPP